MDRRPHPGVHAAAHLEAAGGGRGDGRITAELVSDEDGVTFVIEDNGVGLPAKDLHRLTEPYVTTREKGTGLGLAIVKRILEDHGGELALDTGHATVGGATEEARAHRAGRLEYGGEESVGGHVDDGLQHGKS